MTARRELHTAYAYSPKYRTYTFAAYIRETGHPGDPSRVWKTFCRYAVDDTREAAERRALEYVGMDARELPRVDHGRKDHATVTGYLFP